MLRALKGPFQELRLMKAKKPASARKFPPEEVEAAAWRRNKILKLLEAGESREEARKKLGIGRQMFASDIRALRGGFKAMPGYLPPKGAKKWSPKRAESLIEHAKKIIEGKRPVRERRIAGKPFGFLPVEKHRKIIAKILKGGTDLGIARELGVSLPSVARRRKQLEAEGRTKSNLDERRKRAVRNQERKTGCLGEGQISLFLEAKKQRVRARVARVYRENRKAFDFDNMVPEQIEEEAFERLAWRLQTFDPEKMAGPEETKLGRYFSTSLGQTLYDLKRKSWRHFRKVASLEAGMEEKADIRRRLQGQAALKEITPEMLKETSKALNLDLRKKAIVFAIAAGMTTKQVGNALGLTQGRVSQVLKEIMGELGK